MRLDARKLNQDLLDAEVTDALGREPYERRPVVPPGYGDGYKERHVDARYRGCSGSFESPGRRIGLEEGLLVTWGTLADGPKLAERIRCWVHKMRVVPDKV